jgi:hypothetical protein
LFPISFYLWVGGGFTGGKDELEFLGGGLLGLRVAGRRLNIVVREHVVIEEIGLPKIHRILGDWRRCFFQQAKVIAPSLLDLNDGGLQILARLRFPFGSPQQRESCPDEVHDRRNLTGQRAVFNVAPDDLQELGEKTRTGRQVIARSPARHFGEFPQTALRSVQLAIVELPVGGEFERMASRGVGMSHGENL